MAAPAEESPSQRIDRIERELSLPNEGDQAPAEDAAVSIAPFSPVPELFDEEALADEIMAEAMAEESEAPQRPAAVRPAAPRARANGPRMPSVEEFPAIAQDQMRAHAAAQAEEGDKGALGLLRKLAHVGMPKRDDEAPAAPPQASQPVPTQHAPTPRTATPPQAGHDGLGRQTAAPAAPNRQAEEDAMDIPAFLRRKSG
jgi:cell division protein FtsZ